MIVMLLDLCLAINTLDLKYGQIFITKFNISNLALSKIVLRVKLNFLTFMFIPLSSNESRSINAYGRCPRQVFMAEFVCCQGNFKWHSSHWLGAPKSAGSWNLGMKKMKTKQNSRKWKQGDKRWQSKLRVRDEYGQRLDKGRSSQQAKKNTG